MYERPKTELEVLVDELVARLEDFNCPEMLNGYLDAFGGEFNERLKALGRLHLRSMEEVEESRLKEGFYEGA